MLTSLISATSAGQSSGKDVITLDGGNYFVEESQDGAISLTGVHPADLNMDGVVDYEDERLFVDASGNVIYSALVDRQTAANASMKVVE